MMKKSKNTNMSGIKSKLLHGSNWIVTIAAVVAAVILVNLAVGLVTEKLQIKIDLTPNRVIGITDTTRDILSKLDKNVNIVVFEDKSVELPYINEILDKYLAESSYISRINVDTVADPGYINKYELSANDIMSNSMVVECGDKYKLIQPYELFPVDSEGNMGATIDAEGVLTSAIVYVTSDENTVIGVVEGHGETDFLNSNLGYTLKQQYIEYEYINLYTQDIPDYINYLVIDGAQQDFTDSELDKIDAYLGEGKALQVMVSATAHLNNLEGYLGEWGLKINNDAVKDNNPNYIYNSNKSHIWVEGDTHQITAGLSQIIVPYSKSIEIDRNVNTDGMTYSTLFTTSPQAESTDNETGDTSDGQFILSMLAEDSDTGASILVVGSSSMYSDSYLEYNSKFFTNAISYQLGTEQVTLIEPKSLVPASLDMTASDIQLCRIIVVFFIPFAILVWGFIVWLRRRHL